MAQVGDGDAVASASSPMLRMERPRHAKNIRGGHALSYGETLAPHCSNPRTYILAPPKTVGVQS